MLWFIINAVVNFATTGEGQLLVFPKGGQTAKGVRYVLDLKKAEEVQYWTNRLAQAKTQGADGLMVKAKYSVSEKGYPNRKEITTKNGVIPPGGQVTYYVRLTEEIKAANVTEFRKGQGGAISTIPTDNPVTPISSIPS